MSFKNIINFLKETENLKILPYPESKELKVQNPSSCAQHIFRTGLTTWLLIKNLNLKADLNKVLSLALVHDLAQGDFPSLIKSLDNLPEEIRDKLLSLLQELKEKESLEKKLVLAGSLFEAYLELWEKEGARLEKEKVLTQAENKIEIKEFYQKFKLALEKAKDPVIEFIFEIGKLKNLPRRGWIIRKIPDPETVADHTFTVTLLSLLLLSNREDIDLKKALKMALIHEICAVYAGDYTPHDIFSQGLLRWFRSFTQKPRLEVAKKQKLFLQIYKRETKSLQKLINKLPVNLQGEILSLWIDFVEKRSLEAQLVDQLNCIATYLKALEYSQKYKDFPLSIFVENVYHFVSDQSLIDFVQELNSEFSS